MFLGSVIVVFALFVLGALLILSRTPLSVEERKNKPLVIIELTKPISKFTDEDLEMLARMTAVVPTKKKRGQIVSINASSRDMFDFFSTPQGVENVRRLEEGILDGTVKLEPCSS